MKTVSEMTVEEKAHAKKCVSAWQRAEPELERMRREDIRHADTAASIPAFDGLFEGAIRDFPMRLTSGLVEQQRCFRRAKR
jgi:hypothetical protein